MASIVATLDAMADEGIVENAATIGADVLGPGWPPSPSGTRSSARCVGSGCSGRSSSSATRRRTSPSTPSVMGKVKAAALSRGLLPFLADNRVHVVPPCVVTADEACHGLALLDEALDEVAATL